MCSICGILGGEQENRETSLQQINARMKDRGPDQSGIYLGEDVALGHNRLAIIDPENGIQPMTRRYQDHDYTIVYNGELYNTPELTAIIRDRGITPETYCDTEVVLYIYILFGEKCASMLNGIFAFAVYDGERKATYFARDRFGVKPLFYTFVGKTLVFSSEMKGLLQHPGVKSEVDQTGLWQLIFLAPVRLSGGIFKGIEEVEPAQQAVYQDGKLTKTQYWNLEARECRDSREEIIEKTKFLLTDAIQRQLVSDVPLCTLLSGGLDSSVISAVAASHYREQGLRLNTYSFEYEGNRENFHSSLFQPQSDDAYALYMAEWLGTEHHVLTAPTEEVAGLLGAAALARDFPGQADIDSSLLYYCRLIKERHTVAMSGECADEIFGGYPWFYRPEMLNSGFFPWIHDPMLRASLFDDRIVRGKEGCEYMREQYRRSMANCPVLEEDSDTMRTSRRATWLSVNYFMASLLERKDRMSMASSVEVRVPFADHRILEYVYNVPWEIKFENGAEKALLRNAMAEYLPEKNLYRKKSPYPKTQNPKYEELVRTALTERLRHPDSPLGQMLNRRQFDSFLQSDSETWFGQLMSKPQLLAWLLQFDFWAERYQVNFTVN